MLLEKPNTDSLVELACNRIDKALKQFELYVFIFARLDFLYARDSLVEKFLDIV